MLLLIKNDIVIARLENVYGLESLFETEINDDGIITFDGVETKPGYILQKEADEMKAKDNSVHVPYTKEEAIKDFFRCYAVKYLNAKGYELFKVEEK